MNQIAPLSKDMTDRFDYLISICREKGKKRLEKNDMKNLVYQSILSLFDDSDASGGEQQSLIKRIPRCSASGFNENSFSFDTSQLCCGVVHCYW